MPSAIIPKSCSHCFWHVHSESKTWVRPLTLFIPPQIEGLMDDVDFKAKVTRVEFEELCADLFERVARPVQQALQSAEMNLVRG